MFATGKTPAAPTMTVLVAAREEIDTSQPALAIKHEGISQELLLKQLEQVRLS